MLCLPECGFPFCPAPPQIQLHSQLAWSWEEEQSCRRANDGVAGLQKKDRCWGRLLALLASVVSVVKPHASDFARAGNGRAQVDGIERRDQPFHCSGG